MTKEKSDKARVKTPSLTAVFLILAAIGTVTFTAQAVWLRPQKAWQAYLISFLLFSAIAQGGLLFSTLMHTTRARWSGPLSSLAESFTAFFPVSLILFIFLFLGQKHVFPWIGQDLHGKEAWLNIPFLFTRDLLGLMLLYALGLVYLYHALWFRLKEGNGKGRLRKILFERWRKNQPDPDKYRQRMTVFGFLYMLFFAFILSLIGYDLVMSMDPYWFSTLFGAYSFVKSIYVGFGGVIILAAVLHLSPRISFEIKDAQFHDMGKLYFAFCLVWADFLYAQLVVIWYGNIPEETAYLIERTMHTPWKTLAWTVFIICFIAPFLILINKKIKTMPKAMIIICSAGILGIWLEHLLLLGPAYHRQAVSLPLDFADVLVAMGFFGLLAASVTTYFRIFPEILHTHSPGASN